MTTRERLLNAAERLYATQGIDAVSLREIQRASGVKNVSALQYHFGDRVGLLKALLDKHSRDIEQRRHALLDRYESVGTFDLRALSEALVLPLAAKLSDLDGGGAYLRIYADLLNRRDPLVPLEDLEDRGDSIVRWRKLADPFLDPVAVRLHRRLVVLRFIISELAGRAVSAPHTDDRVFIAQLIDLAAAMLSTPSSSETARLLAERDHSPKQG
ncbi:TetR/AcrR family transcriptional regulator [Nocardia asteroides]|uniref:TetR/AcrR family transcriptional regulator n=1 Tax=Nocardia asteroides TaxID=1824 RepID=UPI001E4E7F84|nr:TetR family transcriptional regulator [Nocardia asteroides]UGT55097.1 TetR family transcriptional regulator [Nocardia asteroides]